MFRRVAMMEPEPIQRWLGTDRDYEQTLVAMRRFSVERGPGTPDEFWLLSHAPVFTQGLNGRAEHLLDPGMIPVMQTDRGGQVTYHGPGQLVLYTLVDLARAGIGVRDWVDLLEQVLIDWLAARGIPAQREQGAPGVYVGAAKIAALGLKVRRGRCYHGLSLNLDMDLAPFGQINPCGVSGRAVTRVHDLQPSGTTTEPLAAVGRELATRLSQNLARYWQIKQGKPIEDE